MLRPGWPGYLARRHNRFARRIQSDPRAARLYRWLGPALVLVLAASLSGVVSADELSRAHSVLVDPRPELDPAEPKVTVWEPLVPATA